MATYKQVPQIDLESLAGHEQYANVLKMEAIKSITTTNIRGKDIDFFVNSKRLLWQSLGHEYIEPELLDFIDSIPTGARFFDIGASTGLFAIYAACKGCQVVAFEPEAANFSILSRNAFLNRNNIRSPLHCFNFALSNLNGISNIFIKKYEEGGHLKIFGRPQEVGSNYLFSPEYVQPVLSFTLDEFLIYSHMELPEYIKIDIDGAELLALKGMSKVLTSPELRSIFIELEENNPDYLKCIDLIEKSGFSLNVKKQVQNYAGLYNLVFSRE